jgi:hypothetical protein
MRLFHVSDQPDIARFEPRPPPFECPLDEVAVWAIAEERLHLYLLPRDCPRVCFDTENRDGDPTSALEGGTSATSVIAVEWAWLRRIDAASLYLYEFPADSFRLVDEGPGYWITNDPVIPIGTRKIVDCLRELADRGIEVRFTPSLWPLRDAVARSGLRYSFIRMRNAQPRVGSGDDAVS